jgi:hypothetical protein
MTHAERQRTTIYPSWQRCVCAHLMKFSILNTLVHLSINALLMISSCQKMEDGSIYPSYSQEQTPKLASLVSKLSSNPSTCLNGNFSERSSSSGDANICCITARQLASQINDYPTRGTSMYTSCVRSLTQSFYGLSSG